MKNPDRETIALSTNPKFIALLEKSRSRRRTEGGISSAEMRHRLGLDRERSRDFRAWVDRLPKTGSSLPDNACDRDSIYE